MLSYYVRRAHSVIEFTYRSSLIEGESWVVVSCIDISPSHALHMHRRND